MRYQSASILAAITLAGAAIAVSTPILAHHSFSSEFDVARPIAVEGSITKLRIVNPHGWIYLDVKNSDGSTTNWGFEFGSPTTLSSKGLKREDLPIGSKIKIDGYRARNTGPFGYAQSAELSDGRIFRIGSAPDAPQTGGAQR